MERDRRDHSEVAITALAELERSFPDAGIMVATRTHYISPPLPGAFRAKLLPFNRRQRADYLRQTLGDRADDLRVQLEGNRVLDDLTRTPFILAEVVTIYQSGNPVPATRIGVLGGVVKLIESSPEHRSYLQMTPLSNRADHYLTHLAAQMTARGEVLIAEEDARDAIQSPTAFLAKPIDTAPTRTWCCTAKFASRAGANRLSVGRVPLPASAVPGILCGAVLG